LKKKQGKEKPGVTRLTQRVDPTTWSRPGYKSVDFIFIFILLK
jgi:hypothetical protein